jgi:hypothetical protein
MTIFFSVLTAILVVLGQSSVAYADGFRCETVDSSLSIKAFNNTQPSEGTRNAAVLVLSDPSVKRGRKTIARFTDVNGTLRNSTALYSAKVDLRFNDSERKGEYLLGTRLGYVSRIDVAIDFAYGMGLRYGDETRGTITLVKRDGAQVSETLNCRRYLKHSND